MGKLNVILKFSLLVIITLIVGACGPVYNSSVEPYLHQTYRLPHNMYLIQTSYKGVKRREYDLRRPDMSISDKFPEVILPSFSDYRSDVENWNFKDYFRKSGIVGIVYQGTRFKFLEYRTGPILRHTTVYITITEGAYAGLVTTIDEDSLLKGLHLKKVRVRAQSSALWGVKQREDMVEESPFMLRE